MLIICVFLAPLASGCLRTIEPGTTVAPPTSSRIAVTTVSAISELSKVTVTTSTAKSTATKTTAKTPADCTSTCTLSGVKLLGYPIDLLEVGALALTPLPKLECNTLTVTCTANEGNVAYMDFDDKHSMLASGNSQIATAVLTCTKGEWFTIDPLGDTYGPVGKIWCFEL